MKKQTVNLISGLLISFLSFSQEVEVENGKSKIIDSLTYEQQSGLPVAASKIYFSDKKYTISGFGETSYNHYLGPKNRESNDLELYNTNLQRFVLYGAYRPVNWLVMYAEIFAEFVNDGNLENHFEYLPEVFVDFLIDPRFNVRLGSHQVNMGFINNNDEPILFYTVNRPEVERIIIPSQWIDLGVMTYGKLSQNFQWTASVYQGLDAKSLNGSTWIRRGRDEALRFNFDSYLLNGSLKYTGIENTEIAVNGLWTPMGLGETFQSGGEINPVKASTTLGSAYVRYTKDNFSLMALGALGRMNNTEQIYHLTSDQELGSQVMGSSVYGYYAEMSYDILPLLGFNKKKEGSNDNFFYRRREVKLPVFARIERLNTHESVSPSLQGLSRLQSDITALSLGFNFNTRKNIVFKANYQFRWSQVPMSNGELEGDRVEVGFGFIF